MSRTVLAFMFIAVLLLTAFVVYAPDAAAASSVDQCNSEHNIAGHAVECSYDITNTLNGTATSSTVVFTHCHGSANAPPTMVCNSSTTNSTDLVTSVSQCNYAGDGGGGTMECSVNVVNNITGAVAPTPATVNQCNGSADGTGVRSCSPFPASTSGATVTQCNDSGNGGGSTMACTVDSNSTTTSLLAVSVNQCNNSENGGGSTVTCRTGLRNNITPPTPSPTPSPTVTPDNKIDNDGDKDKDKDTDGGNPDEGTPDGGTSGGNPDEDIPDESVAIDIPDDDTGVPNDDTTTNQVTKIPFGGASTGGGSTSGLEHTGLLILGFVLMAMSASALVIGRRVSARN